MTAPSSGGGGQIVSAGSASGSIYDLGYRNYDGPRLGRRHAVASLVRQSYRLAYGLGRSGRAKIVPIGLAGLAAIPAIVALGLSVVTGRLGGAFEGAAPINFSTYYGLVSLFVALFVAAQAPELLGRDLRYRVLVLYFTRALRRDDYAMAKLGALVLAILTLLLLPQLVLLIGLILVSADIPKALGDQLSSLPPVLIQSVVSATMLSSIGLAIAAFTPRRAYAIVAIIAVFIIPPIVAATASRFIGDDVAGWLTLLSPTDVLDGLNAFLFGVTRDAPAGRSLPDWSFLAAAIVMTAGAIVILLWRYRRIEP